MKLAFLSHTSSLAGAEKMLVNLSSRLNFTKQYEIIVIAYGKGELKEETEKFGLRYVELKNPLPWYVFVDDQMQGITSHWQAVSKSKEEIKGIFIEYGVEYIVVNTMTSLPGVMAANELRIPSALWIHGIIDNLVIPNGESDFKMACDRILIHSVNSVFCPSEWIKSHYEFYRNDITVIPNFTDVPDFHLSYPVSEKVVFSCFNTWNSLKGIDLLIEAAALLVHQEGKFLLNCYGSGDQEEQLNELIASKGLEGIVRLNPRVRDINEIYRDSHALVTASLVESFGMTLIEAMAHGRPVIASNTGGHTEVIEHMNNGMLVQTDDPVAFAKGMKWIIDNRDHAESMGANGYLTAVNKYNGVLSVESFKEILLKQNNYKYSQGFPTDIITQILQSHLNAPSCMDEEEHFVKLSDPYIQIGEPLAPFKIKFKRSYVFNCTVSSLHQVQFLIGTHNKSVTGKLKLKIFINKVPIRECCKDLSDVSDNSWVLFDFIPITHIMDKEITLTLSLDSKYDLSVYEDFNNKNSRLRNIMNKFEATGSLCCRLYF